MSIALNQYILDYNSETDIEKRLNLLSDLVNLYFDSNHELINPFLEKELRLFEEHKQIDGIALVRYMLAYSMFERGEVKRGEVEFKKVMDIFPLIQDLGVKAQINNFLAFVNSHRGNFDKAFHYAYECIRLSEQAEESRNKFWGQYTLGVLYFDLKDYPNSEKFYTQAWQGFKEHGNKYGAARSQTGLSSVFIQLERYDEAEKMLQGSLVYYRDMDIESGKSRSLNDLGMIFKRTKKYDQALVCYNEALQIRKSTNHAQGIATTLNELAELHLLLENFKEAEQYLQEAKEANETIGNRSKLYRTHFLFTQLYKSTNEPWKALEHYELYDKLKTEVVGEAANNKIKELQTKIATEKAEKEAEIERLRNVELKSAYNIIEEKNKEITDSIKYAKRLQEAILPSLTFVKKVLPESFVLYKPKDIVAGDFYWLEVIDEQIFIAAADCTGHGVPGALVSVVCSNALNRAVKEFKITDPGKILDKVRELVIETFSKSESEVKDGMDISLCCINTKTNEIKWTGAHNPLWYVKSGVMNEVKADKQPIGIYDHQKPFTTHTLQLKKGDSLYLFTDGYADQFGGEKGKKFLYKRMNETLFSMTNDSMDKQHELLVKTFNDWKGKLDQVDDVCVIGIKL